MPVFKWSDSFKLDSFKLDSFKKDLKTDYPASASPLFIESNLDPNADRVTLFFVCQRCLERFSVVVDSQVFKLSPSKVASYMKKHCPDCEAYFEMQKKKPENNNELSYRRKIDI